MIITLARPAHQRKLPSLPIVLLPRSVLICSHAKCHALRATPHRGRIVLTRFWHTEKNRGCRIELESRGRLTWGPPLLFQTCSRRQVSGERKSRCIVRFSSPRQLHPANSLLDGHLCGAVFFSWRTSSPLRGLRFCRRLGRRRRPRISLLF